MRILLISHTCQSATEGQPKAECLARVPGVDLCVLTPDRWKHYGHWRSAENPIAPGYRFEVGKISLPWVGPAQCYLHYYPKLRELLESFRPQIIDLWEEPWGLVSAQACRLRNRILPNAKVISETEQNIHKRLPFPFERFRRYTLRHADFAVARSDGALAVLRETGYQGPAGVVSNGVDAELFKPLDRKRCRRELDVSGFVVGYVGRLVEEKGLADLVEAVARCPVSANVLLVGDGPMAGRLLHQAKALGLAERIRILPARPLQELPAVMNAMDVLVLPSRTTARWKEQFGRVLIEANACETPVIGSDSGAIADVVGEGGLIFRERDAASLAATIRRLLDDPALARTLGMQGRRQVLAKYTWQRVAEQMHAIYQTVIGREA